MWPFINLQRGKPSLNNVDVWCLTQFDLIEFDLTNLGIYSLGVYCLKPSILDLTMRSLNWVVYSAEVYNLARLQARAADF